MHTIDGTRRMFTPWSTFFSDEGRRYLRRSIELALDEDGPDLTAQGLFAADAPMHAVIRAREDTRVVGLPVIHEVFEVMGADPHVEMLVEEAEWLPQYAEEIERAKERLQYKTVPYRPVEGFTLQEKTVEEMAQEERKYREMASAAAKENVK